jgi:catechol 2,3-dioxygenase-like lactoylglutathione lyase family enzyme
MNISHISILSVPVKDQEVAKSFYTEKLDFRVLRDDAFGDQRWLQLTPAGTQTSITLVTGGMTPGSQHGVVLATTDIRADHETLKERGVAISEIQEMSWGMSATFADPDGNGWVLQQFAQ